MLCFCSRSPPRRTGLSWNYRRGWMAFTQYFLTTWYQSEASEGGQVGKSEKGRSGGHNIRLTVWEEGEQSSAAQHCDWCVEICISHTLIHVSSPWTWTGLYTEQPASYPGVTCLPRSSKQHVFSRQRVLFYVWQSIKNPWDPQQEEQAIWPTGSWDAPGSPWASYQMSLSLKCTAQNSVRAQNNDLPKLLQKTVRFTRWDEILGYSVECLSYFTFWWKGTQCLSAILSRYDSVKELQATKSGPDQGLECDTEATTAGEPEHPATAPNEC